MTDAERSTSEQLAKRARGHLARIPDLMALLPGFRVRGSSGEHSAKPTFGSRPPMDLDVLDLEDERDKDRDLDMIDGGQGVRPQLIGWIRVMDDEFEAIPGWRSPWMVEACCPACGMDQIGYHVVHSHHSATMRAGIDLPGNPGGSGGLAHETAAESNLALPAHGCCVGGFRPHTHIEHTISSACSWLSEQLDRARDWQWFSEFADDVARIHGKLNAIVRDTTDQQLACTSCGWHVIESHGNGTWYRCAGCGTSWTAVDLANRAKRREPKPLTTLAKDLGIKRRTLRIAVDEGRIKHVARDGNTRLYDPLDAAAIAARTRLEAVAAR